MEQSLITPPRLRLPSPRVLIYPGKIFEKYLPKRSRKSAESLRSLPGSLTILDLGGCTAIGPAAGAPLAAMVSEAAIASGAEEILFIGAAGALALESSELTLGQLCVAERWLTDSSLPASYEIENGSKVPSSELGERLVDSLTKITASAPAKICLYSTDAPFRETPSRLGHITAQGAAAIEMEFSGVASVCSSRNVAFAGAFVISDIVRQGWEPAFRKAEVQTGAKLLAQAAVSCL